MDALGKQASEINFNLKFLIEVRHLILDSHGSIRSKNFKPDLPSANIARRLSN